jgi:maleate isomerase
MTGPRPKRLGMIIPSSNTVVEQETPKLLPTDGSVTTHISRLRIVQISGDEESRRQFELDQFCAAANLLADAKVDLILWNGTAASWLGSDWDHRLIETIVAETGIPTTTSIVAINDALGRAGAKRIGLVTPYNASLETPIIENYAARGVRVAAARRRDLTENTAYAAITPDELADMAREVARADVDAIVILCTNLAGASVAPSLQVELEVPVIDSVRVSIEYCLEMMLKSAH